MSTKTLYQILEAAQSASIDEIKSAYRRQAMKWHPDRNPGNLAEAERRFKEIGYAYKVLSDPEARMAYDAELESEQTQASQSRETRHSQSSESSREDADTTFFDEMLDLAFELSRRGYEPDKILKMLLALDCPEPIAVAVAKRLADLGATGGNKNRGHQSRKANRSEQQARAEHDSKDTPDLQHEYAGFWIRFAASIADGFAIAALWIPLFILIGLTGSSFDSPVVNLLGIGIGWIYYAKCESGKHQATWGKRAVGLKVIGTDGDRLSFGRAIWHHFCRFLSMLTLNIGYLIQPFTARRQTLHDMLARSVVVRIEKRGSSLVAALVVFFVFLIVGILAAIAIPQFSEYNKKQDRFEVRSLIKNAQTSRIANSVDENWSEEQSAVSDVWSSFISNMHIETAATDSLVTIFKDHPQLKANVGADYDPNALHYEFTDRISQYLQSGLSASDAVRTAAAEFQAINFDAAVLRSRRKAQLEAQRAEAQRQAAIVSADVKIRMQNAVRYIETNSPELAQSSPNFNERGVNYILEVQKQLLSQGVEPDAALLQAYQQYLLAKR